METCEVCNRSNPQPLKIGRHTYQCCGQSFCEWKCRVEHQLRAVFHVHSLDIPDAPYYDWWRRNIRPDRAARLAVRHAGEF